MRKSKTHKFNVRDTKHLDVVQKGWEDTLGTSVVNHAVTVVRDGDKLVVVNELGHVLEFKVV